MDRYRFVAVGPEDWIFGQIRGYKNEIAEEFRNRHDVSLNILSPKGIAATKQYNRYQIRRLIRSVRMMHRAWILDLNPYFQVLDAAGNEDLHKLLLNKFDDLHKKEAERIVELYNRHTKPTKVNCSCLQDSFCDCNKPLL